MTGGHPPIRTASHPWGALEASHKNLTQVNVASQLLLVALWFAALAVQHSVPYIVEHPAEPTHLAQAASIWKLDLVCKLLHTPNTKKYRILQGFFGAPCAKPTDLLVYQLEAMSVALSMWGHQYYATRPWHILTRRDLSGSWKTAVAKAYPSRMNAALSEAMFQHAVRLQAVLRNVKTPDFGPLRTAAEEISTVMRRSGTEMGQDYAH